MPGNKNHSAQEERPVPSKAEGDDEKRPSDFDETTPVPSQAEGEDEDETV